MPDDNDRSTERQAPVDIPDALGLLLRLLHQHWGEDVGEALREAGLDGIRAPHANVFPFVPPGGIAVSELARAANMRKQSMAEAVDQLERAGYVERRPDPHDRRARLVSLTERGEAVRSVAVAAGHRVEQRWTELTGPAEIAALRTTLQRLLSRLRARQD
ncbi:MarR family winged helix-turn-helix transcriptional regulator [Pseudonocardia lacus]|uniref:MarR family winged helix-turn-helix transcriptional regulator n=1 Tax=Pseudonocardia lacus TaxID=2835865 RepID=UPI0027E32B8E|nr:MarR family transcriptional regulator [Pseudonocardia lacus]